MEDSILQNDFVALGSARNQVEVGLYAVIEISLKQLTELRVLSDGSLTPSDVLYYASRVAAVYAKVSGILLSINAYRRY